MFGGTLIGVAAGALLLATGKTAGVSGILEGVVLREKNEAAWKLTFIAGLLAGGVLLALLRPASFTAVPHPPLASAVVGGTLVGFGTRLSGGCTSGHGICGVGRLSTRSIVAMITFTLTGMLMRAFL